MGTLLQDIRYGFRMLAKDPAFTIVAMLTLAIAIGATSAIYSVVRTTIIDPLPVDDSDRLMYIESFNTSMGRRQWTVNAMAIRDLRRNQDTFAGLAVYQQTSRNFKGGEFPYSLLGAEVSPNFFSLWGIAPLLGRTFAMDEDRPGAKKVVILSRGFWRSRLGSDPNIISKTIEFDSGEMESHYHLYTVVGVMPAHFKFPYADVDFWVPGGDPDVVPNEARGSSYFNWLRRYDIAFRLPEEVAAEKAQAVLDTISVRHAQDSPRDNKGWQLRLRPLSERFANTYVRRTLWTLFAVIGLV